MFNPTCPGVLLLTEEQRIANRQAVQKAYYEKSRKVNSDIQTQNSSLNEQVGQSTMYIMTVINERDQARSLLQSQTELVNEKERIIQLLQAQNISIQNPNLQNDNTELRRRIAELELVTSNQIQVQNENVELRRRIEGLESTVSQKSEELTLRNAELSELRNSIPPLETRYQQQISNLNAQINTLQSDCVRVDLNRRLEELTRTVEDKARQEQLCLQNINQLTSDNSGLKIFHDIVSDINSRYPKILPSFINELQQPGNQSQYPEINAWAQSQLNDIGQNNILSLESFKRGNESPVMNQNVQYVAPVMNQNIQPFPQAINQNIPINNQPILLVNAHPMLKDPNFQIWLQLYRGGGKDTNEYTRLYQNLRNKYNETPISVLKAYI